MGTTSTTAAATFNGSSTYAADLQNEITRAVAIASLPLTQLNNNVTDLTNQGNELTTLQNDFTSIQTAIQGLDTASNGGGLSATVSDTSVASVNFDSTSAVSGGVYDLNVIKTGSATTTVSNAGLSTVTDPSSSSISSSSTFTLTVNNSTYTITPATNTLNDLVKAINSSGAAVNAAIVNLGSTSAPDYRLSIQSTALGNVPIQLNDGSDLLHTSVTGTLAQYQVNGEPGTISSDSSSVTLAPGLTATLLGVGDTTIDVAASAAGAENAISALVSAYNQATTDLNANHGTAGGALTGQSIVFSLAQSLRQITGYSGGTGAVQSLADLGVSFNQTGQLTFNQAQFANVASSNAADIGSFLGSATSGGFLGSASAVLTGLVDPSSGIFQSSESTLQKQIAADNQEITRTQNQVTQVQNQMTAQMAAADSLIASLQSQNTYFTSLFQAEQTNENAIANG